MSDSVEINEQFVLEEDELIKRIFTCTETSAMVLYLFYEKGYTECHPQYTARLGDGIAAS
jgi:hypothetical protein